VRHLIDAQLIPHDVTPMVITQLREDLIATTVRSVAGARRVIVHLYNAVAPAFREIVFGMEVPQIIAMVEHHVRHLRQLTEQHPETEWVLQYSPETFCMAELDVSLAVCNAAIAAWDAGPKRPMIINLPTTVEVSTANVFADQIEWMDRRLARREHITLSVHPHNDRGTGVACAEQALLAGAQRVEGCLFGNGERSGNVDLVTLALNLYTQGIAPGLDFSDIAAVARIAEASTALPIHPRHPYVGDLVFTAFSGSHQDAIAKGFAAQKADAPWRVPYLPIDPQDLGRTYDSIVRVNSQSGKGGIAFLLQRTGASPCRGACRSSSAPSSRPGPTAAKPNSAAHRSGSCLKPPTCMPKPDLGHCVMKATACSTARKARVSNCTGTMPTGNPGCAAASATALLQPPSLHWSCRCASTAMKSAAWATAPTPAPLPSSKPHGLACPAHGLA
jgi:2-isopropylmalate synthase